MSKQEKPLVAEIVRDEVRTKDLDLFHDPNKQAYARIPVGEHLEVYPIASVEFAHWVRWTYYKATGLPLKKAQVTEAINLAESAALFDGDCREVFVRVGSHQDRVYLDLGDPEWRAVEIDSSGWRLTNDPKAMLRRSPSVRPLPTPPAQGDIALLRPFLNVDDDGFVLIVAFLVSALAGIAPFPILVLQGEAGAGKSTLARLVGSLVDPCSPPLLGTPNSVRDLMIAARDSWLLAFDNLSGVRADLSDALCRLATGAGYRARRLHGRRRGPLRCGSARHAERH